MKIAKTTIITTLIATTIILTQHNVKAEPITPTATCADTCGYAVVSPDGVVHGVIVCQEGCFGGRMPDEYMGCPPGCALVLQAPKDSNGNVAGIHGPDIIYNPNNNTFERTNPNDGQIDWSLESGQPFENAYNRPPQTTLPPQPSTPEETTPTPNITIPETTPETTTPTTQAPDNSIAPLAYKTTKATNTAKATNTTKKITTKPKTNKTKRPATLNKIR